MNSEPLRMRPTGDLGPRELKPEGRGTACRFLASLNVYAAWRAERATRVAWRDVAGPLGVVVAACSEQDRGSGRELAEAGRQLDGGLAGMGGRKHTSRPCTATHRERVVGGAVQGEVEEAGAGFEVRDWGWCRRPEKGGG
eukprot:3554899-Rhodomonas_salina.5